MLPADGMWFPSTLLLILSGVHEFPRPEPRCHLLCLCLFFPSVAVIAALAHETDSAVSTHWYTDRKFTIVVTAVLVILPLSIPKEIGFQKYARYRHSASVRPQGPNTCSSDVVFSVCLQRFERAGDLVRDCRGHYKVYLAG